MSVFFTRRGKAKGIELFDNFADNSWETIIWACQTRNVPDTWTVKSQKPMLINGTNYPINIIGLGHDDYADGSGKAPITFQMHNCYNTPYRMKGANQHTNQGGYSVTEMRNTSLPAVLALMPPEAKAAIRGVHKKTSVGGKSTTLETTEEKLFALSEVEVFGTAYYSAAGEGRRYEYYEAGGSADKISINSDNNYWLRSPVPSSDVLFAFVYNGGGQGQNYPSNAFGVPFAFCF